MPVYKFTAKAESDLEAIIDYTLRAWGPTQAIKYVEDLETLAAALAQTPDIGKVRDDLQEGLTVFQYEKHLLFYCKEPHGITIVRILHESMDTPQHFR